MTSLVRQLLSFALALALTWWLLYRAPGPAPLVEAEPQQSTGPVSLRPVTEHAVDVASFEELLPPQEPVEEQVQEDPAPPPPEAGSRDGAEDGEEAEEVEEPDEGTDVLAAAADAASEADSADATETTADGPGPAKITDLAQDEELLKAASKELAGTAAIGFSTTLISSPEDQLDIARAFGEELVLVPRNALDPNAKGAVSYRLDLSGTPRVVEIPGRPPLERYRQYRDLFAYEFRKLPRPLRTLRSSVVRRDEVYVFAALIPVQEWAVVVGRRREAAASLGVDEDDVERYVLRYVRRPGGRFDFQVEEVRMVDGRVLRPSQSFPTTSARSGRASR
ncbi:MAG: hypothetical protein AAGB93_15410 [Planctomycetota bacterium]